jgi:hypothetical protein
VKLLSIGIPHFTFTLVWLVLLTCLQHFWLQWLWKLS